MTTLYHNPRCSKSRATLALLTENGVAPEIINYLETPPDAETLKNITVLLGGSVRTIIRTNENLYRELDLADQTLSEDALINMIATHPQLLERPIVVHAGKAVIGRPPENVLTLL